MNRESADTLNDLAIQQLKRGATEPALKIFEDAIRCWPEDQRLRRNFARVLFSMGRDAPALALLRTLPPLSREPESVEMLMNMLQTTGQTAEAQTVRSGAELTAQIQAGDAAQAHGDAHDAAAKYSAALKMAPGNATLCRRLAEVAPNQLTDGQIAGMEDLLTRPGLPDAAAADLHIALFRVLDARGIYADAFAHLDAGNTCKRRTVTYHEAGALHALSAMGKAFPADIFKEAAPCAAGRPTQLFIVGMPRSGTTLMEQILASHSEVYAAGERNDFPLLTHALCPPDPAQWPTLPQSTLAELGAHYRVQLQSLAPSAMAIVDKLPANAVYAGLITLALPGAKIIWVERDMMETCFSCYTQLFSGNLPYMYEQGELGRYARAQNRLLRHWEAVLPPERFLHITYEDFIAEPEANMRALIAFCGLGWQEECLHFEKTERAVHTASALAVRQPLNRTTGGRWKPYAAGLTRLRTALAGDQTE